MELRPHTLPHPSSSFRTIFERLRDTDPELSRCGEMMLELVQYLEDKVDAPPKWAGTRGAGELLIFADDEYAIVVTVNAYPRAMNQLAAYEIKYALEPPWSYAVGHTAIVEEAAQMILYGFKCAYPKGHEGFGRKRRAKKRSK
ncbi:MAG: hypothetical protein JOZ57_10585 [Abitibacteriaceae bacterium]|nr:hypothetical protein [Abditibacteriaceae bacterium]